MKKHFQKVAMDMDGGQVFDFMHQQIIDIFSCSIDIYIIYILVRARHRVAFLIFRIFVLKCN